VVTWAEIEQCHQHLNAGLANLLCNANNLKITDSDLKAKLENTVEAGADVNVRSNDKYRTTALMAAFSLTRLSA